VAKVRVYELAKELGVESKVVMTKLQELGEFVRSASSTVEPPVVRKLREQLNANGGGNGAGAAARTARPAPQAPAARPASAGAATAAPTTTAPVARPAAPSGPQSPAPSLPQAPEAPTAPAPSQVRPVPGVRSRYSPGAPPLLRAAVRRSPGA